MRNVIVTGASRGLGLGIGRRLVTAGYRVIGIARNESPQRKAAAEEAAGSFPFIAFDLAEIDRIPALVKSLKKTFGPFYGLVNNAGISFDGVLALMRDSEIAQLIRLNTLSPIVLTKYVVRSMMADGGGRVVNVSSIIAGSGSSGLSVYGATKASIVGFTRSLAREVGHMGVNVNAVAPGFIDTDLTSSLKGEQRERVIRRSALRRLAEVDDVADAVEFLLGEKAKSITGTVLTVDAGSTA